MIKVRKFEKLVREMCDSIRIAKLTLSILFMLTLIFCDIYLDNIIKCISDLNKEGIHLPLSRHNVVTKVIEIIGEHIPEVRLRISLI